MRHCCDTGISKAQPKLQRETVSYRCVGRADLKPGSVRFPLANARLRGMPHTSCEVQSQKQLKQKRVRCLDTMASS